MGSLEAVLSEPVAILCESNKALCVLSSKPRIYVIEIKDRSVCVDGKVVC